MNRGGTPRRRPLVDPLTAVVVGAVSTVVGSLGLLARVALPDRVGASIALVGVGTVTCLGALACQRALHGHALRPQVDAPVTGSAEVEPAPAPLRPRASPIVPAPRALGPAGCPTAHRGPMSRPTSTSAGRSDRLAG